MTIERDYALSSSSLDPKRYYWMRYASDRGTRLRNSVETIALKKGDLFGVREIARKDQDEVLVQKTGTLFRLPVPDSERLMDKSKEYKGSTPTLGAPASRKAGPTDTLNTRYMKYLKSAKTSLTSITRGEAKRLIFALKDPVEAQKFRNWLAVKAAATFNRPLSEYIKGLSLTSFKQPRVVVPRPVKPSAPTTVATQPHKVKATPELFMSDDELLDSDIPSDILDRARTSKSTVSKRK